FIHIFHKNQQNNLELDLSKLVKEYKSEHIKVTKRYEGNITSFFFTNETDNLESAYNNQEDFFFTPVGIFTRQIDEIAQNMRKKNKQIELNYIKDLEGQFAIAYADYKQNTITAYSHVARIETIYSYVSENEIIIGTDPMLIGLIAYNGKIEFDTNSMYSFLSNGYYADDQTPFKN